ncbi:hypothetical protein Tco_0500385 [Tanacetum coccineum]
MTSGREITPLPGFSAVPTTTTMFAATTPENMPLAYHASTSTNPSPVISPTFVEANYETLESLLKDRRREMESRPELVRAITPPLPAASPRVRRRREEYWGLRKLKTEGKVGSKGTTKVEGLRKKHQEGMEALSNSVGGNIPPNCTFLSPNAQPFIPASLNAPNGLMPMHGSFANLPQGGHVPLAFTNGSILPQNGFMHPVNIPPNSYPFYTQPMYAFPNMPAYANTNSTGPFPNPLGSVTPFVRWIEDYPLPDGLKMPSHIGSYNGKGDPDNFLHLFEGAIRIQKWLMPVACHMFTYTLKDSAKI